MGSGSDGGHGSDRCLERLVRQRGEPRDLAPAGRRIPRAEPLVRVLLTGGLLHDQPTQEVTEPLEILAQSAKRNASRGRCDVLDATSYELRLDMPTLG